MCGLCGVLGGDDHWTSAVARPGVYARADSGAGRRQERAHRVRTANLILRHYRLTLSDWQGTSYLLSSATGKTELVDNLAHLWPAAERLTGRPCDPLAPDLIAMLEGGRG
jgi:hypothetical protein